MNIEAWLEKNLHISSKIPFGEGQLWLNISAILLSITLWQLIKKTKLPSTIVNLMIFSLFIGLMYLLMDAPDVAMTETAIGAAVSTSVLLLVATKLDQQVLNEGHKYQRTLAVFLCLCFGIILFLIFQQLEPYGTYTEVHNHVSKYYLEHNNEDIGIPSVVAAILGSYRGFDTFGETIVIFVGGIAVLLIFARKDHDVSK